MKKVVWKEATGGYFSYSNCGYAGTTVLSTRTSDSMTVDRCGNICAATSTCNYFTFAGTACKMMTSSSASFKPVAYVDSTRSCGRVLATPTFTWMKFHDKQGIMVQISTKCDLNGSSTGSEFNDPMKLSKCRDECLKDENGCNFFTLSNKGICSLMLATAGAKPSIMYSPTNSECGYIPSRF